MVCRRCGFLDTQAGLERMAELRMAETSTWRRGYVALADGMSHSQENAKPLGSSKAQDGPFGAAKE